MGSCVANQCAGILLTVVPRFVAPICSKTPPDLGAGLQDGDTLLLWFDLGTILFLENPKIRQTSFCAGSLGGAPIHTHFTNSKTKTLFKDIEVLYSTSFTATGISMLQMYSQTAVRLRLARSLRCCCVTTPALVLVRVLLPVVLAVKRHVMASSLAVFEAVGGTGRPLGKTFFLHCQRRHPELPKIPTYLFLRHQTQGTALFQCIICTCTGDTLFGHFCSRFTVTATCRHGGRNRCRNRYRNRCSK